MTVDIIIPCRNEKSYIERCIKSIIDSNYPLDLINIYVCDGLSDDGTTQLIDQLSEKFKQVHLLINKQQTTPYALNLGIKASSAKVKMILGAHAEIHPEFIKENVEVLQKDNSIGCSGGIIKNIYENETSKIIGMAMSSSFGVGNAHFRTGGKEGFVDTVAFGAYKKEVFKKVGYFDQELARNQDDEFNFRLIKNNYKIYLSKKIISSYYVRASFQKLFKQYYQYGFWKVYVNKKHRTITTLRQLIPSLLISSLSIGLILSFLHHFFALLVGLEIIIYLLGCCIFAFQKARNMKQISAIIFTFFILHFGYGIGYLIGFFEFILFRKNPMKKNQELTR
ncbi:MAG: glycosyltransferase family 2 protein [Parvicellaceae bacterium]